MERLIRIVSRVLLFCKAARQSGVLMQCVCVGTGRAFLIASSAKWEVHARINQYVCVWECEKSERKGELMN